MTPTEARPIAQAMFPGCNVENLPGRLEITIDTGITFAMLQRLSDALGTDRINIRPAEEGHCYSSWTYDSGSPAKIVVLL